MVLSVRTWTFRCYVLGQQWRIYGTRFRVGTYQKLADFTGKSRLKVYRVPHISFLPIISFLQGIRGSRYARHYHANA